MFCIDFFPEHLQIILANVRKDRWSSCKRGNLRRHRVSHSNQLWIGASLSYGTVHFRWHVSCRPNIIGIGRALVINGSEPKLTVAVARTFDDEKDLLQTFWQKLRAFTKERGIPTFVTWNGLGFTFPFLIERSTALGVEPSCILPRARFQPWKHLDLFAELAAYDPHRYMSLQSRLCLWRLSLNGNGSEHQFGDHDLLTETWRKGNPKPLEDNLKLTLEAIQRILNRVAPYFLEARKQ